MSNKSSTNSGKHPYLRWDVWETGKLSHWHDPDTGLHYSDKEKHRLDVELRAWIDREKRAPVNGF